MTVHPGYDPNTHRPRRHRRLVQVGVVWCGCGYPTRYGFYSRIGDDALDSWVRTQTGQ